LRVAQRLPPVCAAPTDVTGFGLLAPCVAHRARHATSRFRFEGASLPELPGARALWTKTVVRTGGAERNESVPRAARGLVERRSPRSGARARSPDVGGLLLAVPPDALAGYLSAVPGAVEIGVVEVAGKQQIVLG
jgi:selenophosphate synthase